MLRDIQHARAVDGEPVFVHNGHTITPPPAVKQAIVQFAAESRLVKKGKKNVLMFRDKPVPVPEASSNLQSWFKSDAQDQCSPLVIQDQARSVRSSILMTRSSRPSILISSSSRPSILINDRKVKLWGATLGQEIRGELSKMLPQMKDPSNGLTLSQHDLICEEAENEKKQIATQWKKTTKKSSGVKSGRKKSLRRQSESGQEAVPLWHSYVASRDKKQRLFGILIKHMEAAELASAKKMLLDAWYGPMLKTTMLI